LNYTGLDLVVICIRIEVVVYVERVKYSFIGLAVKSFSAMKMGGVLDLRILFGSGLKGSNQDFEIFYLAYTK